MVFKCSKGYYQVLKDFKNAFDLDKFIECYIEECLDRYPYIVGDLSDGILRLKGFTEGNNKNGYNEIPNYISLSCAFEAPYYILKRIASDAEYDKLLNENREADTSGYVHKFVLEKENFDRDSLILESNPKHKPRIVLDLNRINSVKIGNLPADLKSDKGQVEDTKTTTYVSVSEGFVPKDNSNFNRNKNNRSKDKKKNFRGQKNNGKQK